MKRPIQIISAPSILGLRPTGVEHLPESLLRSGLVARTGAIDTIMEVPTLNAQYSNERETETNSLNTLAVRVFSNSLMQILTGQLNRFVFPLVLGGDCSILIGIMPALKMKGTFGLTFLDAHADFYQPAASVTGELADMDLAILTGRGPEMVTNIGHLKPYIEDRNIIHIGQRDAEQTRKYGSQEITESGIKVFDLASIRKMGEERSIKEMINHIDTLDINGYWIHFDTDVISDEENPAVDYRLPGGLSFEEAGQILHHLIQTGKAAGMSVTVFNPGLDKDGSISKKIVDCLAYAFNNSSET